MSMYMSTEQAVAEAVRAAREAEAAEAALRQGSLSKGQRKNRAKKAALAAEVWLALLPLLLLPSCCPCPALLPPLLLPLPTVGAVPPPTLAPPLPPARPHPHLRCPPPAPRLASLSRTLTLGRLRARRWRRRRRPRTS